MALLGCHSEESNRQTGFDVVCLSRLADAFCRGGKEQVLRVGVCGEKWGVISAMFKRESVFFLFINGKSFVACTFMLTV